MLTAEPIPMVDGPKDDPEGTDMVLMSVTLFRQWVAQMGDVVTVDWGKAEPWSGRIYAPTVRREYPE